MARGEHPPPPGAQTTSWQERLRQLSAPQDFLAWAGRWDDFETCWQACPAPDWLLWTAARLARDEAGRRAVVFCSAALAGRAMRDCRRDDQRITAALGAAQAWATQTQPDQPLAAAEQEALEAAMDAAIQTADARARARRRWAAAPRRRLSSVMASRAIAAQLAARAADSLMWAALAAVWTLRSAATADHAGDAPEPWAACLGRAAGSAVMAATLSPTGRSRKSAARISARYVALIREQLPCPPIDGR